ncbi:hypothetical protein GJ496_006810 [Pomphorhynchus laevis]|nr:hypothetical protein GJ496_006810 [Pomphorhynchus laevis]
MIDADSGGNLLDTLTHLVNHLLSGSAPNSSAPFISVRAVSEISSREPNQYVRFEGALSDFSVLTGKDNLQHICSDDSTTSFHIDRLRFDRLLEESNNLDKARLRATASSKLRHGFSKCSVFFQDKNTDDHCTFKHNAIVYEIDGEKVVVMFLHPTCLKMLQCVKFLNNKCDLSPEKCR